MNDCSLILIDSQAFPLGNQAFLTSVNTLNIPEDDGKEKDGEESSSQSYVMAMLKIYFWLANGQKI